MARVIWVVCLSIALVGCGGGAQMVQTGQAPIIKQDESMIVFMRASALGGVVAASVVDVSGPDNKLVGIVQYGTRLGHPVKAGEYTFMVIGESADFMQAKIEAGRTYYALVTPRVGVWKARFSFRPVRLNELDGSEFAGWSSAASQYVENSGETQAWAAQNAADISAKRAQYWPEWSSKPEHQRTSQTLNAEDGKPTAFAAAAPAAAAAAPAPAAPSSPVNPTAGGVEVMFWESIRNSTNPADFRAYLEQYPKGQFAVLARNRLAKLETK